MDGPSRVIRIELPVPCIVVMIGTSGSGKSTFTRKHFRRTEILSSDFFRALVSDDENNQAATGDAFDSLYFVATRRLARGRLCVIDATNVRPRERRGYVALAAEFQIPAIAIVLDLSEWICLERNAARSDRRLTAEALLHQRTCLHLNSDNLMDEGFQQVHVLCTPEQVESVEFARIRASEGGA